MGILDSLTDAFTGRSAKEAADKQRTYLQGVQTQGNAALDTGLDSALGYVNTGAGAARGALGTARSDIGAGTDAALGRLDTAAGAYTPLSALGTKYGAATTLGLNALGVNGPEGTAAARAAFEASPGYEFQLDQGLEAINRARNARGMLNSGNTDRDAQLFGMGVAKQDYGTWLNNLLGFTNPELGATSGAASGVAGVNTNAAKLLNERGINLGNVDTRLAGLETDTGRSLADLVTNNAARKVNLGTSIASPYSQTYGQEAAAEQQGSANLWNLGINAAKLAAGIPGLGGTRGTLGDTTGARV